MRTGKRVRNLVLTVATSKTSTVPVDSPVKSGSDYLFILFRIHSVVFPQGLENSA